MNQSQPQTLVIAVFLLYLRAAFAILFGVDNFYVAILDNRAFFELMRFGLVGAGGVAAGYGIANEQKWGYQLGVAVAAAPLVAQAIFCFRFQVSPLELPLIGLLFDVALFALLLHPQSRDYQRIWFSTTRRTR